MRIGRVLLLFFGSTVLFFLFGALRPKLVLAQLSTISTPTSPSDVSQAQATTTEGSYRATDKQDRNEKPKNGEASSSSFVSAENAPTVDPKFNPKNKQAFLEEFVERFPTDMMALRSLLTLYMRKGKVNSAVRVLDKLLSLEPDNIEWKYLRAQAYDFSGDVRAARGAFEELSKLQPLSARILQGLAISMQKMGENPAVIIEMLNSAVKKAVSENKTKEARNLRVLLGQILTLQGNLDDALKKYKQMEEEDSHDFRPCLCQGLVYTILGKTKEAEKCFRRYHELCPIDFPNRGYLDGLMLRSKVLAYKYRERERKKQASGSIRNKSMKQPDIYGRGPSNKE